MHEKRFPVPVYGIWLRHGKYIKENAVGFFHCCSYMYTAAPANFFLSFAAIVRFSWIYIIRIFIDDHSVGKSSMVVAKKNRYCGGDIINMISIKITRSCVKIKPRSWFHNYTKLFFPSKFWVVYNSIIFVVCLIIILFILVTLWKN